MQKYVIKLQIEGHCQHKIQGSGYLYSGKEGIWVLEGHMEDAFIGDVLIKIDGGTECSYFL